MIQFLCIACVVMGAVAANAQTLDNKATKDADAAALERAALLVKQFEGEEVKPLAQGKPEWLPVYRMDLAFQKLRKGESAESVKKALAADASPPSAWLDRTFLANRKKYLEKIKKGETCILIVGGVESCGKTDNDFPDVVRLFQNGEVGSGVVICDGVILTAKHVVRSEKADATITMECDYGKQTKATGIVHFVPEKPGEPQLDLAVVFADPKIVKLGSSRPWATKKQLAEATEVCCVGFGDTDPAGGGMNGKRRVGRGMTVTSCDCYCSDASSAQKPGCTPCLDLLSESGINTPSGQVIDICSGDSGGPMFILDDKQRYCLGGITRDSRRDQAAGKLCGGGAIFVRVDGDNVRTWLKTVTKSVTPPCTFIP